jgi:hypothetical protein
LSKLRQSNSSANNGQPSSKNNADRSKRSEDLIEWRRSKVTELLPQGYSIREIASMLQVSKSTIGEDVIFLRQEAKQNISNYINDRLPYEFEQCVVGISKILRQVLKITDDDTINTREKMKALSLAKDCYAVKLNLLGNAGVINSAMRNRYKVKEPDNEDQEKYLEVGKQTSEEIDSHLSEGHMLLKIQRFGLGKDTRYHLLPA